MKIRKNSRALFLLFFFALFGASCFIFLLFRSKSYDVSDLRNKSSYFIPIKIKGFSQADIPYVQAEIEGKTTLLKIDLGYSGYVCLSSDLLESIDHKLLVGKRSICGMGGKKHECAVYKLPKFKIGCIVFDQLEIEESNIDFEKESVLIENTKNDKVCPPSSGCIGWYLLSQSNILIDCKHSNLALCDSLETLQKQGYPTEKFVETRLLIDEDSIDFEAITKEGPLRCILDTGSTWNLLNKDFKNKNNDHMIFRTDNREQHSDLNPENKNLMVFNPKDICDLTSFQIGNKDFGPITFNRIKSPIAFDAVIGMEFFESTAVFIDFRSFKLYFFEYP